MSHHAVDIYLCCCKIRTLNLLLVPSYIRCRAGMQVRILTGGGLPRVRIRIVKEDTHRIGTEQDVYEMLARNISWVPQIVHMLQNN